MNSQHTILTTVSLSVGYRQQQEQHALARDLNLNLCAGELTCLLGPNGIGKSTLMRTLAGMHLPLEGSIHLQGMPLHHLKAQRLAQKISVVLTDRIMTGNLSAYSVVAMGRYPYTGWLGRLNSRDKELIEWAIHTTGISHLATRHLHHLSDGERQKVMIARALAQDTPIILLDEPTVHLDLPNRMGIVSLLRKLVKETNKTVLMSTHALDLALQSADKMWLMHQDTIQAGVPEDLVLNGVIEQVFQKKGILFDLSGGTFRLQPVCTDAVELNGQGAAYLWTQRALEREGYAVDSKKPVLAKIEVTGMDKQTFWTISRDEQTTVCHSVEELVYQLRKMKGITHYTKRRQ